MQSLDIRHSEITQRCHVALNSTADSELSPSFWFPNEVQRWELSVEAQLAVEIDGLGNHAVTFTGHEIPQRRLDFLFEAVAKDDEAHARPDQLLHCIEFFRGKSPR